MKMTTSNACLAFFEKQYSNKYSLCYPIKTTHLPKLGAPWGLSLPQYFVDPTENRLAHSFVTGVAATFFTLSVEKIFRKSMNRKNLLQTIMCLAFLMLLADSATNCFGIMNFIADSCRFNSLSLSVTDKIFIRGRCAQACNEGYRFDFFNETSRLKEELYRTPIQASFMSSTCQYAIDKFTAGISFFAAPVVTGISKHLFGLFGNSTKAKKTIAQEYKELEENKFNYLYRKRKP